MDAGIICDTKSTHFEKNKPVDGDVKTDAGCRDIPIFLPLWKTLSDAKKNATGDHVCVTASGSRLTNISFRRGWEALLAALERSANGFPASSWAGERPPTAEDKRAAGNNEPWVSVCFTPHDLRHTFSTYLYDSGADVKTAQYLMGHANIDVTMKIYTHLTEQRKQASIASLEAFMNNGRKMVVVGGG